jgi:hypothetical protein
MIPVARYIDTLALLTQALQTLDELGEGIAAAHLSGVIDMISQCGDVPSHLHH